MEQARTADQRVLRWYGYKGRMNEYYIDKWGVDGGHDIYYYHTCEFGIPSAASDLHDGLQWYYDRSCVGERKHSIARRTSKVKGQADNLRAHDRRYAKLLVSIKKINQQ